MKIIEHLPAQIKIDTLKNPIKHRCDKCKSLLEVSKEDLYLADDKHSTVFNCPVCGLMNYIDIVRAESKGSIWFKVMLLLSFLLFMYIAIKNN